MSAQNPPTERQDADYVTLNCRAKIHQACPGWFREDVFQPWSNAICACTCHQADTRPKVRHNDGCLPGEDGA